VPLSIWVSFFVTAIFSHVAESLWLWVLPLVALVVVLAVRWRNALWPRTLAWWGALTASILIVACVTVCGMMASGFHVHGSRHLVKVGQGDAGIWIVLNTGMMGDHYGKAVRRYMEDHPLTLPVTMVDSIQNLPQGHQGLVVVSGSVPVPGLRLLRSEGRLMLVNPNFFPQEAGISSTQVVSVLFGEFSQSPSIQAWQSVGRVQTMEGVGDFIASWPEFVFNSGAVSSN
jgi:hypothetical protein